MFIKVGADRDASHPADARRFQTLDLAGARRRPVRKVAAIWVPGRRELSKVATHLQRQRLLLRRELGLLSREVIPLEQVRQIGVVACSDFGIKRMHVAFGRVRVVASIREHAVRVSQARHDRFLRRLRTESQ